MIKRNVFIRGAITVGQCFHENNLIFGPAYISAYKTEKFAKWPRIVIHPDVINHLSGQFPKEFSPSYFLQDNSGIWFLDYLTSMWIFHFEKPSASIFKQPEEMYSVHKKAIIDALHAIKEDSDLEILTKYSACAHYHNSAIDKVCKSFLGLKYVNPIKNPSMKSALQSYKIDMKTTFPTLYK
jgi:hypothetical protein